MQVASPSPTASPVVSDPGKKRKRNGKEEKKARPPVQVKDANDALQQYLTLEKQRRVLKEQSDDMKNTMKELEPFFRHALSLCQDKTKKLDDGKIQLRTKKKTVSWDKEYMVRAIGSYLLKKNIIKAGPQAEKTAKSLAGDMTNFIIENQPIAYREVIERKYTKRAKKTIDADSLEKLVLDIGGSGPSLPAPAVAASTASSNGQSSRMDI